MGRRRTRDAVRILEQEIGDDRELHALVAEEHLNARIARMIVDARTEAGLTQKELAARVGTSQSVIARLEDSDYEGHSLSMLQRIGAALDRRIVIEFEASESRQSPA